MHWFQVEVEEGQQLFIFLEGEAKDVGRISVRHGAFPTRSVSDACSEGWRANQALEIPSCRAGTYYILLEAGGRGASGTRRLRVETSRSWRPVELGQIYQGKLQGTWDRDWYRIDVEEGEELFVFLDKPDRCELDAYLRHGSLPSLTGSESLYDLWSRRDSTEQVLHVPETRAGSYYLLVRSEFGSHLCTAYSIRAETSQTWDGPTPLALDEPHRAKLPAGVKADWYQVTVGEGEHLFVFLDKPSPWHGELLVRHGLLPSSAECDAREEFVKGFQAVDVPDTLPGTYYVKVVRSFHTLSGGDYILKATTSPSEPELPRVELGGEVEGELRGWWGRHFYAFSVEGGGPRLLVLQKPDLWEGCLYVRYGRLPADEGQGYLFDLASERVRGRQVVEVPAGAPAGDYYALVESGRPPANFGSYSLSLLPGGTSFLRGDANANGSIDISDAVHLLRFLFAGGGKLSCGDAADVNDDELLNLADAVGLLQYLFASGTEPPAPGPIYCGADLTPGEPGDLGCEAYEACP